MPVTRPLPVTRPPLERPTQAYQPGSTVTSIEPVQLRMSNRTSPLPRTARGVFGAVVISGAASVVLSGAVLASHDWGHLYYKTFIENGTWDKWRISTYTDSDNNNDRVNPWSADYTHAFQKIRTCVGCDPIRIQQATCGPAANVCERVVTNYSEVTIDGDYYYLDTTHCGYDDVSGTRHRTPQDRSFLYPPCSDNGLALHEHSLQFR